MRKLFVLFVLTALPLFSLADVNQVEIGGLYYNLYDAVEASETEGIPASEAYAELQVLKEVVTLAKLLSLHL